MVFENYSMISHLDLNKSFYSSLQGLVMETFSNIEDHKHNILELRIMYEKSRAFVIFIVTIIVIVTVDIFVKSATK